MSDDYPDLAGTLRHPDLVNALAQIYAQAGDGRNKLAGDAWPTLSPMPYRGPELRAAGPRPADWAEWSGVGENAGLAPLRTGAGLGEMLGRGRQALADQDWRAAADMAPLAAMAFMPGGPKRAPASLAQRLEALPQAPRREVLPSDFSFDRSSPLRGGKENWDVRTPTEWKIPGGYGGVSAEMDPATRVVRIMGSALPEEIQGTGAGWAAYDRLFTEAHKKGYAVHSDNSVSPEAQRIYEKAAQLGYRVERNPRAEKMGHGRGESLKVIDPSGPVFTVHPPEYASPLIEELLKKYVVPGAAVTGAASNALAPDKAPQQ